MKLEFQCWRCAKGTPGRRVIEPFNESGAYSFRCAQGHVHEIVLAQMRFEVLAETAMQALVDGYYRDAVASFMASLERVYQFYCEVVFLSKGDNLSSFEGTWKLVSSQSERQLGMFIALYHIENEAPPPLLASKYVTFRNRVIHQGVVPSEKEAIDFAQAVVDLVQPFLNNMMPRYTKEIERVASLHASKASSTGRDNLNRPIVFFEFILKFDTEADDWNPASVDIGSELATRRVRTITD